MYFADEMIGEHLKQDKDLLIKQLRQFELVREEPEDKAFGKFKYTFTGKTSGGEKDDMVLALMIALWWRQHDTVKRSRRWDIARVAAIGQAGV